MHIEETLPLGEPRGTIIAIPGLGESAGTLNVSAKRWAEAGWHVVAIDPRGHGRSPRWTPELLRQHPGDVIVRDLLETLDHIPTQSNAPLIGFGHSAGGAAIAAVAAALTERFSAVVLEDPFWRLPVTHHQDPLVARAAAADLRRQQGMTDQARRAEIETRYPLWPSDELAEWSLARERMDVALVANGDVIPSTPWPALLQTLQDANVPTQMITGTVKIGNTEPHRAIERSFGVRVDVVAGASHFIRRDFRPEFHRLVEEFLEDTLVAPKHHPNLASASSRQQEPAPSV